MNPDKIDNLKSTISKAKKDTEAAFKNVDMAKIFHELVSDAGVVLYGSL